MGDNLARRGSDIYYSQSDAVLRLLPASRNEGGEYPTVNGVSA